MSLSVCVGTDEESEKDKQKRIPEWARGQLLKEALEKQYGLNGHTAFDPDSIFTGRPFSPYWLSLPTGYPSHLCHPSPPIFATPHLPS